MRISVKRKKIIFIVFGVAFVLALNFFQTEVKGFFYDFSLPIQRLLWNSGGRLSDFFGTIPSGKDLQSKNKELKKINLELMVEIIDLQDASEENAALREALGVGLEKEFVLELAEIIGKDISQDSVFIDRGSSDGLAEGMPIINQQKVLLGKITEVYPYRAKIMLISNKNSSFDAEVSGGISGLLKGKGGGKISLELLPKNEEIKEGALVVSTALGGTFPSGLLVGTIQVITKNDIEPFQAAEISPFFSLSAMKQVFIILNF